MSTLARSILSILAVSVYGWVNLAATSVGALMSAEAAGKQFDNSDASYVSSVLQMNFWSHFGISSLVLFGILGLVWFAPLKKLVASLTVAALLAVFLTPHAAMAYVETVDKTEIYAILPNQTAYWVPGLGANKDTQVEMDSEAYLRDKKIPGRYFQIPHVKLSGTGGSSGLSGMLSSDYYVPTGKMYLVDRTTFSHEWVDATDRGTSIAKEGIHCQTKEGINLTAGISVGASVTPDNAAKFMFNFGTLAPTYVGQDGKTYYYDTTDLHAVFASVLNSRSVKDVMQDIGRKKIQTLVCAEITKRSLDEDNIQANDIMVSVTKNATEYFASKGITLDFLGWSDTFTFDKDIQEAINEKYIATTLASNVGTLQAIRQMDVQTGLANGLTQHGLPIVVTPDMFKALQALTSHAAPSGN